MLLFLSSFLLLAIDGLANADGDLQFLLQQFEDNKLHPHSILQTLNLDLQVFSYLNAECKNDLKAIAIGLMRKEMWAIKMLDAYGKPGSGLTQGKFVWPGRFSMCINVTQEMKTKSLDAADNAFRGQFCWIQAKPKINLIENLGNVAASFVLKIGICIPDSCNNGDLSLLLTAIDNFHFVNKYVNLSSYCVPSNRYIRNDKKAVISLMFCCLMLMLCLIASTYDIYLHSTLNLSVKNNAKSVRNDELEKVIRDRQISRSHGELPFDNEDKELLTPNSDDATLVVHKNKWEKLLLCFSFYTNGKKLFRYELNNQSLLCLDGIRVIAMLVIILAHNISNRIQDYVAVDNMWTVKNWVNDSWFKHLVKSGLCALPTFFVLSGILFTYTVFKKFKTENLNGIFLVKLILYRLMRISPLYFVVLFVFEMGLMPYFSNSPLWPLKAEACETGWWSHLLYIDNFNGGVQQCFPPSWFLAADMQIFILCSFLIFFYNYQIIAAFIAGAIILTNWIIVGVGSTNNGFGITVADNLGSDKLITFTWKPYHWFSAFIFGMACGYVLFKVKCRAVITQRVAISGWITAGLFILIVFMFPDYTPDKQFLKSAYITLWSSLTAISVVWLIFACCNGYGGFVNKFLSLPIWIPLSQLTYSVFLIHELVIRLMALGTETLSHLSISLVVSSFITSTVYSYIAAICLHLVFEAPFARIMTTISH